MNERLAALEKKSISILGIERVLWGLLLGRFAF